MANMRIHELAKEINVPNKDIIGILKNNSRDNLTHMSNVSDVEVSLIRKSVNNSGVKPSTTVDKPVKKEMGKPTDKTISNSNKNTEVNTNVKPTDKATVKATVNETVKATVNETAKTTDNSTTKVADHVTVKGSDSASDNATTNTIVKNTADSTENKTDEAKKSHITQVYNPQNSSRGREGQGTQGGYRGNNNNGNQGGYRGNNNNGTQGTQGGYRGTNSNTNQGTAGGYRGNNTTGEGTTGGYRGTNPTSGQGTTGGYRGTNPNTSEGTQGGYRGNNPTGGQGSTGGYRGTNPNPGQGTSGGYRGNSNYQGQGTSGGYRGTNPNPGQGTTGGYRGTNPNPNQGTSGGYRGTNPNPGQGTTGGYRGNNSTGYQGTAGGYRGNNSTGGQGTTGGYRGNNTTGGQGTTGGYRGNNSTGGQGTTGGYRGNNTTGGQGTTGGYRGNNSTGGQGTGGGYRGNNSTGGQGTGGGYRGNNSTGGQGTGGGYRGTSGQGGQGGYRGAAGQGGRTETTEEKFVIATKPGARSSDYKGGKVNNKPQKDRDVKENLKFVNYKKTIIPQKPKEEVIKNLILPDVLTIKELCDKMKVTPSVVVKKLFLTGKVVTINQEIDYDAAEEIALEYNCVCEHEIKIDYIAELLKEEEEGTELLVARPPVVCVMGHVDHGKTSLLDAIRSTTVTAKESGGITQKIGAYTVNVNGQKITFLDTPGHEAFTAMRMRGAQSTDIAILVVAADDGVMPQTIEAINHAKAAKIDIIVAINKIDKPNANIEKVKQELTEYELVPEEWGGDTIFVPVSAHTKEGIDSLLDMIILTAEMRELKANPNRNARGIVIEAQLDKGKGPVATILVQKGTLKVGDNVAAGSCYGKIRAMTDDKGRKVKEAGPSTPVEVFGLNDVPNAGEIFVATENDKEARSFAETFIREGRERLLDDTKAKLSLDDLFTQIKAGNVKELGIIIKADVQGSVEAIKQSLVKLSNEEVAVKIIHGGVGNINESDVILASASNAIIIGFNVKPDNQARIVADNEKVDMRLYKIIYNAIEDVEAALKGMLEPIYEEKIIGHAQIRQIFKSSGVGNIAGAYVTDGKITKNSTVRIKRGEKQIFEGPLASLKRFKDEVKEVKEGYECGFVFEKFSEIKEEDIVEAYQMVEVPR
ncbi:translation initiation factor IF-2 [[Clostridium] fimetarium]|uniref:Translation initiation factor IF-2 n=1 Tax=[Clostridium] fimetarium TaxID=99656 RepID=A0A1I0N438_9FIRM|nr:translation initiation factor IF-2 [[Clostridium] fimetarium]SEV95600.1 translation initiation factor IF-2 [[Clostridium] fimetarium]